MTNFEFIKQLEARRLRGVEVFSSRTPKVAITDVIESLPGELGSWLVVEILRSRRVSRSELRAIDDMKPMLSSRAMKALDQAVAHNSLNHKSIYPQRFNFRTKPLRWRSVRGLPRKNCTKYYDGYSLIMPPISVLHSDAPRELWSGNCNIESAILFEAQNITTIIESDIFIDSKRKVYLDNNAWVGSKSENFINDSSLLAMNTRYCLLSKVLKNDYAINKGFWLGYPLMDAWGHWVYEGLFRIEIFARHPEFSTSPVIISDAIPANFTELASRIYPEISFLRLESGSTVLTKSLYVAPIRSFQPHNIHWSKNNENLKYNGDPELARDIRQRCLKLLQSDKTSEIKKSFPEKVYIARTASQYRKSRVTLILDKIAENNGFYKVDPGLLSSEEELFLFLGAKEIFGQIGSGLFLSFLAQTGCKVLCVGSDFSHDANGWADMVEKVTGGKVDFILGKRDFIADGFSEGLYHQDFTISAEAIEQINSYLINS